MAQYVCRYRKGNEVKWISHLDLTRTLERAMRRARLALELTRGHHPRPKLSFGPPLPVGATGDAEMLAFHLAQAADPGEIKDRLNQQLPPGLEVSEAWSVPVQRKKETFGDVDVAEYLIAVSGDADAEAVRERVAELLASESLPVHRGNGRPEREVDLRPLILGLEVVGAEPGRVEIRARLRTGSHGGARPQEIVGLLGLEGEGRLAQYHRTGLFAAAEAATQRSGGVWRRWSKSRGRQGRS